MTQENETIIELSAKLEVLNMLMNAGLGNEKINVNKRVVDIRSYRQAVIHTKNVLQSKAAAPATPDAVDNGSLVKGATNFLESNALTLDSWEDNASCVIDYLKSVNALAASKSPDAVEEKDGKWISTDRLYELSCSVLELIKWRKMVANYTGLGILSHTLQQHDEALAKLAASHSSGAGESENTKTE